MRRSEILSTPLYNSYLEHYPLLMRNLENARRNGRLSHAFLLQADTDRARREFSLLLAALAACPESTAQGRPCGVCRVCRTIADGSYPELFTLSPVGKMYEVKIGDRTNPDPNTLRFFEKKFHLTGTSGGRCKVGVIYDADRMNDESQNALLKTLEEPPPATLLILATGNPAALLPTTRSRCQLLPLLENRCEYEFAGFETLVKALNFLVFQSQGNLARAEAAVTKICEIAAGLSGEATALTMAQWETRLNGAAQAGDPALVKRIELQAQDASYGAYMKERSKFLSAIHTFCGELYLLSEGVPFEDLPNPEFFPEVPAAVDAGLGRLALREADDLLFTLRFNVNEELALRTFGINIAMKDRS